MRMRADSPGEGHMDTGGDGRSFTGGPELAVLILRQRLQREWMAQRLRAPAGFLPYEDAAKWVQAQGYFALIEYVSILIDGSQTEMVWKTASGNSS